MADDSIAVVDLDRCQPDRCNYECANFCPPNRTGKECIVTREERFEDEDRYAGTPDQISISEEICLGETCGICVEKCPFDAIEIINLPQELEEEPAHRFGENTFALYGLPAPQDGRVTGMLGPNGIGKTTAVHLLSGEVTPNLGQWDDPPGWEPVLEAYRGTELQDYLGDLREGVTTVARKPQYVDKIPDRFGGNTRDLLAGVDERGIGEEVIDRLSLGPVMDQDIGTLSGGELQRVAVAATIVRDADFYFLDEITPYLDISQRVATARLVRELVDEERHVGASGGGGASASGGGGASASGGGGASASGGEGPGEGKAGSGGGGDSGDGGTSGERSVLVVEHDLAILDMLADALHVAYGEPGAFGIVTPPKSTRNGINEYLAGYLENENMRIREGAIEFERHAPQPALAGETLAEYPAMSVSYGEDEFGLDVEAGEIRRNEVLGIVGPNGIGKSTFAKLLAGRLEPDEGELDLDLPVSYKPQYVEIDQPMRVDAFLSSITDDFGTSYWTTEIAQPLQLDQVMEQSLVDLSGGERQRVAIAACLSREAELYLLDEPSAHLDVEQRVLATRAIRRYAENHGVTAMVVDHDIYMIDLLADRLQVFDGTPAEHGHAGQPVGMREGMNDFLANLDVTFRRDERTGRPRINKPGSRKDREQKKAGEYYYAPAEDEDG